MTLDHLIIVSNADRFSRLIVTPKLQSITNEISDWIVLMHRFRTVHKKQNFFAETRQSTVDSLEDDVNKEDVAVKKITKRLKVLEARKIKIENALAFLAQYKRLKELSTSGCWKPGFGIKEARKGEELWASRLSPTVRRLNLLRNLLREKSPRSGDDKND